LLLPDEEDAGAGTSQSLHHVQNFKADHDGPYVAPPRKTKTVRGSRLRPEAQVWQPMARPLFLVIREELIRMKNMIIPEGWGEEVQELVEI